MSLTQWQWHCLILMTVSLSVSVIQIVMRLSHWWHWQCHCDCVSADWCQCHCQWWWLVLSVSESLTVSVSDVMIIILAVKSTRIAWFSAISLSILNRFFSNFTKAIFYSNPNRPENFVKLYSVFQKLDHLTCNEFKLQRFSLTSLN